MSIIIQEHERGIIDQFRMVLLNEGIVSPGDTIGIDDVTLLLVKSRGMTALTYLLTKRTVFLL